jgi:hypothetical protein
VVECQPKSEEVADRASDDMSPVDTEGREQLFLEFGDDLAEVAC